MKEYKPLVSDGVYHITIVDNSVEPDVNFFNNGEYKFAQSISNLIPRTDRDNPVDDFETAVSYAMKSQIGVVVTNDPKRSISKESVSKLLLSPVELEKLIMLRLMMLFLEKHSMDLLIVLDLLLV